MRFPKANDPIPERCITHSDAFMRYYRLVTPSSAIARSLLMEKAHGEYLRLANGWNRLLGEAEISFRAALYAGELTPLIRDPKTGDRLEPTPRSDWLRKGSFKPDGIHDNFVFPDDPFDPGPYTEIHGKLRPVFYQLDACDAWMKSSTEGSGIVVGRNARGKGSR